MTDESATKDYWAFISYSHGNAAFAAKLHRTLESHRLPPGYYPSRRLRPIFRDREELPASSDLGSRLRQALDRSRCLIVLCSPAASQSRWVNEEILHFQSAGRGDRVLAVIVEGPKPGQELQSVFPPALRETEQLAADSRPEADGWTLTVMKVVAGVLEVELDEVVQRERRHRRKQRALVGAWVGLVVMLLAGVWWSFDQERRAEAAFRESERYFQEARGLLLKGDALAARSALESSLAVRAERWDARFLQRFVEQRLSGLIGTIDLGQKIDEIVLSQDDGRLALVADDRRAGAVFTFPDGQLVQRFGDPTRGSIYYPIRFSPDGSSLMLSQPTPHLVDLSSGEVRELASWARSAAFLEDGRILVVAHGGQVYATDRTAAWRSLWALPQTDSAELQVAGRTALSLGWRVGKDARKGDAIWFDLETGRVLQNRPRDPDRALDTDALHPSGELLVVPVAGEQWEVYDRSGLRWSPQVRAPEAAAFAWSEGGRFAMVTGGRRSQTTALDAKTGRVVWTASIDASAASSDRRDQYLAVGGPEGRNQVFDLSTGKLLRVFHDRIGWPGPDEYPVDRAKVFTSDGELLVTAGSGRLAKIWRWQDAEPEIRVVPRPTDRPVIGMEFVTNRYVLVLDEGGRLSRIDLGGLEPSAESVLANEEVWSIGRCGDTVVAGLDLDREGSSVRVLDASGRSIDRWSLREAAAGSKPRVWRHVEVLGAGDRCLAISRDAGAFRSWRADGAEGQTMAWTDLQTLYLQPGPQWSSPANASADGQTVVMRGSDYEALRVRVSDGKVLARVEHPDEPIRWILAGPDGSWLTAGDDRIYLWDANGKGRRLNDQSFVVNQPTFLGRTVVGACSDGRVRAWSADDGTLAATWAPESLPGGLPSLGAPIDPGWSRTRLGMLSVTVDPEGRWVAAVSDTGHLSVWSVESRQQLLRFSTPPDRNARLFKVGRRFIIAGARMTVIDLGQ